VRRWHHRFLSACADGTRTPADRLDFFLAFAQNCYSLRDWLDRDARASKPALDDLMSRTPALQICRDVANGSKHLVISKPSIDAAFSIGREYTGRDQPERWFLVAGTHFLDAVEFTNECVRVWEEFLAAAPP